MEGLLSTGPTPSSFKNFFRRKNHKVCLQGGFWAIKGNSRPKIERNDFFLIQK